MPANHKISSGASIRSETSGDAKAVDALIEAAFGAAHALRTVRHLRLCSPEAALCFVCEYDGLVIGSIRYWPIQVAGRRQLLLGPLAVDPTHKGAGYGKALVSHSLEQAASLGYDYVLISGEADYYPRFGFEPADSAIFLWPGFIEPERLQIKWLHDNKVSLQKPQAILPILPQIV